VHAARVHPTYAEPPLSGMPGCLSSERRSGLTLLERVAASPVARQHAYTLSCNCRRTKSDSGRPCRKKVRQSGASLADAVQTIFGSRRRVLRRDTVTGASIARPSIPSSLRLRRCSRGTPRSISSTTSESLDSGTNVDTYHLAGASSASEPTIGNRVCRQGRMSSQSGS
jgi:hypothetical protein